MGQYTARAIGGAFPITRGRVRSDWKKLRRENVWNHSRLKRLLRKRLRSKDVQQEEQEWQSSEVVMLPSGNRTQMSSYYQRSLESRQKAVRTFVELWDYSEKNLIPMVGCCCCANASSIFSDYPHVQDRAVCHALWADVAWSMHYQSFLIYTTVAANTML